MSKVQQNISLQLSSHISQHSGNIMNQLGLLILKVLDTAMALSENFLHKVKGGTLGLQTLCLWVPPFSYYLFHVVIRLIPIALLFAHFQEKALPLILMQLTCNLLIRYLCCESRELTVDAYHAISSIVTPTSFGANETKIRRFRSWNCLTFASNLTLVTLTLNVLYGYGAIMMNPIMEVNSRLNGGHVNATFGPHEPTSHHHFMAIGSLFTIVASALLSILSGIFAHHRCKAIEGLQQPLNKRLSVVEKMLVDCGCNGEHEQDGGIEMQPSVPEGRALAESCESLTVDEVAEEATEYARTIDTETKGNEE